MKPRGWSVSLFHPGISGILNFIFPIGLILLNLVLKIIFLDHRDIAMDEPFTIFHAQADLASLFRMLKTENNPPLFFILLHFWIKIFGISAYSVRFLPMIFSILTALVIYFLGKRFYSVKAGVIASLIFTFSNYHMLFAHEARVYSLFGLLAVTSMYFFLEFTFRRDFRSMLFLTLINILLLYSHFFGFYILFIQLICCIIIKKLRKSVLGVYIVIFAAVLISYTPYLSIFFSRFILSSVHGTWVSPPVLSDLYTMVWRFSNAPVTTVFFLILLFFALTVYLFQYVKSRVTFKSTTTIMLIWFFLPYFLMFLVSFKVPMFLDRYLVFLSFGFYFLIGLSISYLGKRKLIKLSLSALSIILMAVTFNPDVDNKRRIREVVQIINNLKTSESVILICPSWLELGFIYYYNQDYFRDYKNLRENLKKEKIFPVNNVNEIDTSVYIKASNIIYFEEWATLVDRENLIYNGLKRRFKPMEEYKIYENFMIYNFIP